MSGEKTVSRIDWAKTLGGWPLRISATPEPDLGMLRSVDRSFVFAKDRLLESSANPDSVRRLLDALNQGSSWEQLVGLVDGDEASLVRVIDLVFRIGVLSFWVMAGDKPLLTFFPQSPRWRPPSVDVSPPSQTAISPFARMVRLGNQWMVENPLADVTASIESPELASWVLSEGNGAFPGSEGSELTCLRWLQAAGVLVPTSGMPPLPAMEAWAPDEAALHVRSRGGRRSAWKGGRAIPPSSFEAGPAIRPRWNGPAVRPNLLPTPPIALDQALAARVSSRLSDSSQPLSGPALASILHLAVSTRRVHAVPGGTEISRSYPSAGSAHPLELYVAVNACRDLSDGLWHFDPTETEFVQVCGMKDSVRALVQNAQVAMGVDTTPDVVVIVAARFWRSAHKYYAITYANILKEAGALLQSIHLAGAAFGVSVCALGSGNLEYFSDATGLDPFVEGSVAELTISGRKPG